MRYKIILLAFVTIAVLAIATAQVAINFPSRWTMNLNQLPTAQSSTQRFYGCDYAQVLEHRITDIYSITWNGNVPTVEADVKYWTPDRKCAGSRHLNLTLLPTTTQGELVTNFVNAVNQEFLNEAGRNRQSTVSRTPINSGGNG